MYDVLEKRKIIATKSTPNPTLSLSALKKRENEIRVAINAHLAEAFATPYHQIGKNIVCPECEQLNGRIHENKHLQKVLEGLKK